MQPEPQRRESTATGSFPSTRKTRDPESLTYDTMKGRRVVIELRGSGRIVGVLHWVAAYTVGVQIEQAIDTQVEDRFGLVAKTTITMLFKNNMLGIALLEP